MCLFVISLPHSGWGPWDVPMLSYVTEFPHSGGWKCSTVRMDHTLFIHSNISGNLGCFHLFAPVNNAALNTTVQISLWDPAFVTSGLYPQVWLSMGSQRVGHDRATGLNWTDPEVKSLDHMIVLLLIFFRHSILIFVAGHHAAIPPSAHKGSNCCTCFLTTAVSCCCWSFLNSGHPNECEPVSHCGFALHFSDDLRCWKSFHMPAHICISSCRNVYASPLSICFVLFWLLFFKVWQHIYRRPVNQSHPQYARALIAPQSYL